MSEIKLTKDSIENAILTDGKLVGGYVDGNGYISATGNGTIVFGDSSKGGVIDASGIGSFAHGYVNTGTISAKGNGAHAEGYARNNSIDASGNGAHAEGCNTKALADGAHAEGNWTTADGVYSHAEGYQTYAFGTASHAEGYQTIALGEQSHAEGKGSTGSLGSVSTASGNQFTLKNVTAMISGQSCTLQDGDIVKCDSSYAKVITTYSNNDKSVTITTDKELGEADKDLGEETVSKYIYLVKGISYGANAHSEGYLTAATGDYSHAEGERTSAFGTASHAGGYGNIKASGTGAFAHGYANSGTISATGNGAVAMGYANSGTISATGNGAHAEGYNTKALAEGAHAEGKITEALGDGAHAEGQGKPITISFGRVLDTSNNSFVLQNITDTTLFGYTLKVGDIINYDRKCAMVISITKKFNRHIITTDKEIGIQTNAYVSLVEGGISSGGCAHSEGYLTMAIENYAHAEGYQSIASATASHAGGIGTIADKEAMTAIGKYNNTNVGQISGDYLFVVGNGTSTSSRSNAFAVTTNGITASLLNLSGGPYQEQQNPGSGYPGGKISWSDDNCWIAEQKIYGDDENDILTIFSSGKLYLKSNSHIYANTNITVTGQVNATGGFYDESDIRKKEILSNISLEKSYELLDKCQKIIYVLKDDPGKKEQVGMIAQEVEEFFPEIISTDNNGFKSLDYARLSVICLRIIKDIVEQIKEIKNEIKNING